MRTERPPNPNSEELILYALLVLIGAIPVAIAVVQRTMFGTDATLGLLMVCAGTIGAIAYVKRAHGARTAWPCVPRCASLIPRARPGAGARSP